MCQRLQGPRCRASAVSRIWILVKLPHHAWAVRLVSVVVHEFGADQRIKKGQGRGCVHSHRVIVILFI